MLQTRSSGKKVSRRTETFCTKCHAERKTPFTKPVSPAKKRILPHKHRRASEDGRGSILFSVPFDSKNTECMGETEFVPGRSMGRGSRLRLARPNLELSPKDARSRRDQDCASAHRAELQTAACAAKPRTKSQRREVAAGSRLRVGSSSRITDGCLIRARAMPSR
jgi:hypothetical protein